MDTRRETFLLQGSPAGVAYVSSCGTWRGSAGGAKRGGGACRTLGEEGGRMVSGESGGRVLHAVIGGGGVDTEH